ncbi:hypothetical protein HAX54_020561 [Datura stramonium]|uniref:Uncharacterized protein n=1 Tax=Datura stramonium TaxID=4076 RepID=A0ABS8USH7_DATST|nr:hypothetical protein [Datura stramonium]
MWHSNSEKHDLVCKRLTAKEGICNKRFDYKFRRKIASSEREIHLLLRKIDKLEASGNHQRAELEGKDREIRGLKEKLEELDGFVIKYSEWKKEKDVIYMVKDELAKRVGEMLMKVSELEKKLEIQENLISERPIIEINERVGGHSSVKWLMVAAIAITILCYHRDGRKA